MKKLLATLLVAVMIMSCMTVVSFAEQTTVYTLNSLFDADFTATTVTGFTSTTTYNDPFTSTYYTYENSKLSSWLADTNNSGTLYYQMAVQIQMNQATNLPTATALVPGEYVAMPIYSSETLVGIDLVFSYDTSMFTFDSFVSPFNSEFNDVTADGDEIGTINVGITKDPTGLIGIAYFTVNQDAVGDESGNANEAIDATIKLATITGSDPIKDEVITMAVPLTGLEKGASSEPTITDITEAEVKAITPVVVGTFEATNMVADIKTAYGVDVTLADEFDAENMSYIPVFASVPTENKNAPAAYGIIIKGEGVEELKIPVTNAVDGKFGVVLYGFTGHIEKYTEAYLYVTVGESTYTSALGDL